MSEEIKLTKDDAEFFKRGGFEITEPTLFIPPKKKVVKLVDLPKGTKVKYTDDQGWINTAFAAGNTLWRRKLPTSGYSSEVVRVRGLAKTIELIEGDWLPWFGGECPWPDGVVVEVVYRCGAKSMAEAIDYEWDYSKYDSHDIITHRCIGLADGYTLEVNDGN